MTVNCIVHCSDEISPDNLFSFLQTLLVPIGSRFFYSRHENLMNFYFHRQNFYDVCHNLKNVEKLNYIYSLK